MEFLKDNGHIKHSYLVCSTGRSGSTLLCKTLKQFNCCGCPEEYFHHTGNRGLHLRDNLGGFLKYFNASLKEGTTPNGIFGLKMHWWQLDSFLKIVKKYSCFEGVPDIEILNTLFPNLKFIYIWRQDMLAQAVSTTIAQQTRVWKQVIDDDQKTAYSKTLVKPAPEGTTIRFQPLKIYGWEQSFKDQNHRWRDFLAKNKIDHYELTYESLTKNFAIEIQHVLDFLAFDDMPKAETVKMATKKQSNNGMNQQFIQKYKLFPPMSLKFIHKIQQLQKQWT